MIARTLNVVALTLCFISEGIALSLPTFLKPCEDFSRECITTAVQNSISPFVKGLTEFGVEQLDPMTIDKLELSLPGGLKVSFNNGKVQGFRNCKVKTSGFSNDGKEFDLAMNCDLSIRGKYKANGRILIFPINGDGDAKIKIKNVSLDLRVTTDYERGDDGHIYSKIKGYKLSHSYDGRIDYALSNLFNGNPELSQAVLSFLNENWLQVANEFGGPIVEYAVERVMKNLRNFFNGIPFDELNHYKFQN